MPCGQVGAQRIFSWHIGIRRRIRRLQAAVHRACGTCLPPCPEAQKWGTDAAGNGLHWGLNGRKKDTQAEQRMFSHLGTFSSCLLTTELKAQRTVELTCKQNKTHSFVRQPDKIHHLCIQGKAGGSRVKSAVRASPWQMRLSSAGRSSAQPERGSPAGACLLLFSPFRNLQAVSEGQTACATPHLVRHLELLRKVLQRQPPVQDLVAR